MSGTLSKLCAGSGQGRCEGLLTSAESSPLLRVKWKGRGEGGQRPTKKVCRGHSRVQAAGRQQIGQRTRRGRFSRAPSRQETGGAMGGGWF